MKYKRNPSQKLPNKKETEKQHDAYEYFFSLGVDRSYPKVAEKFNVTIQSVYNWGRSFGWAERIVERNAKIAKRVRQKLDTEIVDFKAGYRKDIYNNLKIIKGIILTVIDPVTKRIKLAVKTPNDLAVLVTAMEKLIKLDLELIGDDAKQSDINWQAVGETFAKEVSKISIIVPEKYARKE